MYVRADLPGPRPATDLWSIYWVNSRNSRLKPPLHGSFRAGTGMFHGTEQVAGHEVSVRFTWTDITSTTATWKVSGMKDPEALVALNDQLTSAGRSELRRGEDTWE